jgi:hypothetical protein
VNLADDCRRRVPPDRAISESWEGRGDKPFRLAERRALCALAYLDISIAKWSWSDITAEDKAKLLYAMRLATQFGSVCAELVLSS